MMTVIKKMIVLLVVLTILKTNVTAQVTTLGNGFPGVPTDYAGWDATRLFPLTVAHKGDFPINFQTNGTQRMTIMNTTGYVGIRTASPIFPLDVRADGANNVTASGWKAGIHLSNHAALAWDNDGLGNFLFMGHPAFNADHSFYCGLAPGLGLVLIPACHSTRQRISRNNFRTCFFSKFIG